MNYFVYFIACFLFVFAHFVHHTDAGCHESKLCCAEKNNTCRAHGPRMKNAQSKTCFCDESCWNMGDCCTDYKETCRKVDCSVGPWSTWGPCNRNCGYGQRIRIRQILRETRHGGAKCPKLIEKRACMGSKCRQYARLTSKRYQGVQQLVHQEMATIVPAKFGTYRFSKTYNPYRDIRKNLFHHYKSNEIIHRKTYCAKFEITQSRPSCNKAWGKALMKKGETVCTECQPLAMKRSGFGTRCKGHGLFLQQTKWTAAGISDCYGTWVMKNRHTDCKCNPYKSTSFILI